MILIADSGSTKTDWRIISGSGKIYQAKTGGMSPAYQKPGEIGKELKEKLLPQIEGHDVENIFFYGTGCVGEKNVNTVRKELEKVFEDVEIHVTHDLLAAARALCDQAPGIACIAGTGSNSCLYDGKNIVDVVPSLGFILGDEGSGARLGMRLVADYFKRVMPEGVKIKFEARYNPREEDIIEQVYKQELPNRFLASFNKFIFQNIKEPYLHQMVYQNFADFFARNIEKYPDFNRCPVHFTGSIAFYYNNILRQVARDRGVTLKNILESPIAGLTLYHQGLLKKTRD